jgi:signal transduction histidine kinase
MDNYMSSSIMYLESLATRPVLIQELEGGDLADTPVTNSTVWYGGSNSQFHSIYVTDASGKVISSYPDADQKGRSLGKEPYVERVLTMARHQVMGPLANRTGNSTIYVSVPIAGHEGELLGVMVGELDPNVLGDQVLFSGEEERQYIYMVNATGNVIVHTNRTYMASIADFSSVPAIQSVMRGEEGVRENYNPIEGEVRLASFSPVKGLGWGVIVAKPTSVAYRPVTNTLWTVAAATLALGIVSLALAYLFSDSIIRPIMGLFEAARAITNRREYRQFLPLKRKDEIGQVAVCIDQMAQRISNDRERVLNEKDRAELYLDIMGHDINNLNQVTIGNLELIKDDDNLTTEQKEAISDALNSSMGSAGIIDNVRKIQAINEKKEAFQQEDVNDMILECIREAPRPEGKKATISYTPRKGLIINGPALMKEVFCNIINNAIKHSEGDVTIDVRADDVERSGRKFYDVSIADNGPGIPDELKARLFNRFQRGDTKAHGRGLGLFIARSLVESIEGDIRVEDRVPGDHAKGARFVVSLPASGGSK